MAKQLRKRLLKLKTRINDYDRKMADHTIENRCKKTYNKPGSMNK